MRTVILVLLCWAGWAGGLSAQEKPNFVWLISEDNSKHFLKLFDEGGAETPAIAKLASNGLTFEHAFSNAPVCSVARTTLITSCFAPRIGTQYHRRTQLVPMPRGLRMFPAYLREAGYFTTNRQKTDYNAIAGDDVWDQSSRKASWRNRKPGQPFFHKQSFSISHEGSLHFPAPDIKSQSTTTDPASVSIPPHHPNTETFRYTYARYHDRIKLVDRAIVKVVDDLEADGLLDNTFIFYFGDHGGVLPGSKGYANETGLHVPLVVRIPEKWKHLVDAQPGSRVQGFVSFVDFGPTLLNLAGVDGPPAELIDGQPFLGPNVSMDEVNSRNTAYGYADRFDEKYDMVRTIRVGKWKYIRNYQPFNFDGLHNQYRYRMAAYREWRQLFHEGKLNATQSKHFQRRAAEELFDLEADPYETKNLASDGDLRDTLMQLRHRLRDHVKRTHDLSFYPENWLVDNAFQDPVQFGLRHQDEINQLIDTADLVFDEAERDQKLADAVESQNPWVRYWGLIGMSTLSKKNPDWVAMAEVAAKRDAENLNRVRAAEFLGLVDQGDPASTILDCLMQATSGTEANLILNTATLLRDGPPRLEFDFSKHHFNLEFKDSGNVKRRKEYLLPENR